MHVKAIWLVINVRSTLHSEGKAVFELIKDKGSDADQKKIIEALEDMQSKQAKNPDDFNNKKIKIDIYNKTNAEDRRRTTVEIQILTQRGEVNKTNHTVKTVQIAGSNMIFKRVLRWETGISGDNTHHGTHAICSNDYDIPSGTYSCENSWGSFENEPKIHKSRIYAIDYVSIREIVNASN